MAEAIQSQPTTWATRIVARYAQAAEPELLATEEDDLRNTLAAALRTAMFTRTMPDWFKALNSALDQWERDNRHAGPRVHDFDLKNEQVRMRWPDRW